MKLKFDLREKIAGVVLETDRQLMENLASSIIPLDEREPGSTRGGRSVILASSIHGEGTTTLAINIAASLNRLSRSVLYVDGNLRSPFLTGQPGSEAGGTLAEYLRERIEPEKAIFEYSDGFHIVPGGKLDDRESFSGILGKMIDLVKAMSLRYDYLIFDSAPIIPYPDTPMISQKIGEFCLVLEAEKVRWEVARAAKRLLDERKVNILGVILNKKRIYIPRSIYQAI